MEKETAINPKMIVLARQIRGIMQNELAKLLKIPDANMNRIENHIGTYPLSDELLRSLCKVLSFRDSFFQKKEDIFLPDKGYFRKRKTISVKNLNQIVGYMNLYSQIIDSFLDCINIPDLNILEWDIDIMGSPENAAKNLREYWKMPAGRIDNLSKLIEDNGIIIISYPFDDDKMDAYTIHTKRTNKPIIFINDNFPDDRKRLNLAHELGHIILHYNRFDLSEERDIEKEAYLFASEFLVPNIDYRSQLGRDKLTISKLASYKNYWKISMLALIKIAEQRRYMSYNEARYLYQLMAPYRKKEPVEIIGIEKPRLFSEIISSYINDLNYNDDAISELIGIYDTEWSKIKKLAFNNHYLRIA
jgi:Zn-dependent peptidase ImmA (M78 family)/DNA-binding XRE family transcriptional regulator